jgi:membrane-associated phospholipid phosphatase
LNLGKEIVISGVSLSAGLIGTQLRANVPIYTAGELAALDAGPINALDRGATGNYSLRAHEASNVLWLSAMAAPVFFLAGKAPRSHFGTVALLWGETLLTASSLTLLTKYAARRTRPFVYNPDVPIDKKQTANARGSFFSGHTSLSAAGTFFAARVFSDYYPDSPWKPVVWGAAAAIPAATGYFRVKGGRHFPTDVLAGYAVGALAGIFVPQLHRRARADQRLGIRAGGNYLAVSWSLR